jgi:hypothetical protein
MSKWNFALKDRFELAAARMGYEIEHTWGYINMKIPSKDGVRFNCYLWTPLNKMADLSHGGSRTPERALAFLKDNQEDFHIELDCSPESYAHLFWAQLRDASIDDIIESVMTIQDQDECQQLDLLYKLTYGEEA